MKDILVAIDFSENTERMVGQAADLCKKLGGKLTIVHVTSDALQAAYASTQFYEVAPEYVSAPLGDVERARDVCAEEYKREHKSLLNLSARLRDGGLDAQALLLKGEAAELILEQARDLGVDLIVMGSHGHGMLRKLLVGSVTEAVLRKAPCGVLVVPANMD
jgi:nucleotide-binding universal stress UspA family protein